MKIIKNYQEMEKNIGIHPETKNKILLKVGRYGRYLESENIEKKLKRISIPKKIQNEEIDLDKAVKFLSLPRLI